MRFSKIYWHRRQLTRSEARKKCVVSHAPFRPLPAYLSHSPVFFEVILVPYFVTFHELVRVFIVLSMHMFLLNV